jgi:uncharacterized repeat protein (TIGR01451 family)
MRNDQASTRWRAPRLFGVSVLAAGTLVILLLGFSAGAGAVVGATDLVLTKSDNPDPVVKGSNLTYTIQVQNTGTNDASNVVVTDTLPGQVDFVSATPSQGSCDRAGSTVTCTLGQVNAGTTATVTIVIRPKKTGTISNTAVVASPQDTNAANNQDTENTVVNNPGQGKPAVVSCATPTIAGTAGDDVITGTDRADVIATCGGHDQVFALGGKDLVCTGAGFDLVLGGFGGDRIKGGTSADRLVGNAGGDKLKGKAGRDRLRGKAGNDLLNGGPNRDSCKGGRGSDVLKRCP